jgi:hypothetical protein
MEVDPGLPWSRTRGFRYEKRRVFPAFFEKGYGAVVRTETIPEGLMRDAGRAVTGSYRS